MHFVVQQHLILLSDGVSVKVWRRNQEYTLLSWLCTSPQEEALQETAARVIQKAWRGHLVGALSHASMWPNWKSKSKDLTKCLLSHWSVVQRDLRMFKRHYQWLQSGGPKDDPESCQSSRGKENRLREIWEKMKWLIIKWDFPVAGRVAGRGCWCLHQISVWRGEMQQVVHHSIINS